MNINIDYIKTLVSDNAEKHFKERNYNASCKYRQAYEQIFVHILKKIAATDNLHSLVEISVDDFKAINKHLYKVILTDLYNDSLIWYNQGRGKQHSTHGFNKAEQRHFCTNYKLDDKLISHIENDFSECVNFNDRIEEQKRQLNDVTFDRNSAFSNIIKLANQDDEVVKELATEIIAELENFFTKPLVEVVNEHSDNSYSQAEKKATTEIMSSKLELLNQLAIDNGFDERKESDNRYYLELTLDDKQLLKSLPKTGRFADGRIYSKFHCLKRDDRHRVKLQNEQLVELFDIHHTYPSLLAVIYPEENAYSEYIQHADIYTDIKDFANLANRDMVKRNFNRFVNMTKKQLNWACVKNSNSEDNVALRAIVAYMKKNFPELTDKLINCELQKVAYYKPDFTLHHKKVKKLNHLLQQAETKVMTKICSYLTCPYVTLHDAVYVRETDAEAYAELLPHFNKMVFDLSYEPTATGSTQECQDEARVEEFGVDNTEKSNEPGAIQVIFGQDEEMTKKMINEEMTKSPMPGMTLREFREYLQDYADDPELVVAMLTSEHSEKYCAKFVALAKTYANK